MRGTSGGSRGTRVAAALAVALLVAACSGGDDDGGSSGDAGDGDSDAPTAEGSFTVLSYNVAGLPQEISTENPEAHLPLISPLLEGYDVVLTQEDFDWWRPMLEGFDFVNYHERLRADVTHDHRTGQYPGPEAAGVDVAARPDLQIGDGLGILSRFPFDGEERVPWEGCFGGFDTSDGGAADCLAAKGFAVVRMTLAEGVELDVYTLHGEAGGTAEDQALQEADFTQLAAFVAEHSEGRAVLLGGDTNLHTDTEHPDAEGTADTEIWQAFLEATGLTDGCAAAGCERTGAIDKIAFRSAPDGSPELTVTGYEYPEDRFVDDAGEALSDHPPLAAEITWTAHAT